MELANGSRIISLPGSEKTVRGYSAVSLVIMDEAARVPDELLQAVRPMLATTSGRFIALAAAGSTKHGSTARAGNASASRAQTVLASHRSSWPRSCRRSGRCGFRRSTNANSSIKTPPRFQPNLSNRHCAMILAPSFDIAAEVRREEAKYFIGVDLGQSHDPTAIAVVRRVRSLMTWDAHHSSPTWKEEKPAIYQCGYLERVPLGTVYLPSSRTLAGCWSDQSGRATLI